MQYAGLVPLILVCPVPLGSALFQILDFAILRSNRRVTMSLEDKKNCRARDDHEISLVALPP